MYPPKARNLPTLMLRLRTCCKQMHATESGKGKKKHVQVVEMLLQVNTHRSAWALKR